MNRKQASNAMTHVSSQLRALFAVSIILFMVLSNLPFSVIAANAAEEGGAESTAAEQVEAEQTESPAETSEETDESESEPADESSDDDAEEDAGTPEESDDSEEESDTETEDPSDASEEGTDSEEDAETEETTEEVEEETETPQIGTVLGEQQETSEPIEAVPDPVVPNERIMICHRTGSDNNPYNVLEVADDGAYGGHADHEDDIIPITDQDGDGDIDEDDCLIAAGDDDDDHGDHCATDGVEVTLGWGDLNQAWPNAPFNPDKTDWSGSISVTDGTIEFVETLYWDRKDSVDTITDTSIEFTSSIYSKVDGLRFKVFSYDDAEAMVTISLAYVGEKTYTLDELRDGDEGEENSYAVRVEATDLSEDELCEDDDDGDNGDGDRCEYDDGVIGTFLWGDVDDKRNDWTNGWDFDGSVSITGGELELMNVVRFDNHRDYITIEEPDMIAWKSVIVNDYDGITFRARQYDGEDAVITFDTEQMDPVVLSLDDMRDGHTQAVKKYSISVEGGEVNGDLCDDLVDPDTTGASCGNGGNFLFNPGFEATDGRIGFVNDLALNALTSWDVYDSLPKVTDGVGTSWYSDNGTAGLEIQYTGISAPSHGGSYLMEMDTHPNAENGDVTNASVSQDVYFSELGEYEFSYWYRPRRDIESDNTVEFYFDGIIEHTSDSTDTSDWVLETVPLGEIPAGWHTVTFRGAGVQNTYGGLIDDVSLTCNAPSTGTITVIKEVINDDGGDLEADDFTLYIDGVPVTSGEAVELDPGTYTISESDEDGYTLEGFSGDCDDEGEITLEAGEDLTCTLTNDDDSDEPTTGTITVIKEVINDDEGDLEPSDFTLYIDDIEVASGETVEVDPGTYTVSEDVEDGYELVDFGGDCDEEGEIDIEAGEDLTCTLYNDDHDVTSYLRVVKVVINDDGGVLEEYDFPLYVDDELVVSGEENEYEFGTYTVTEDQQDGYEFEGFGGDCNEFGEVEIEFGQTYVCYLYNNDLPHSCGEDAEILRNPGFEATDDRVGIVRGLILNVLDTWDIFDALPDVTDGDETSWYRDHDTAGVEIQYTGHVAPSHGGSFHIELDTHPNDQNGETTNSAVSQDVTLDGGDYELSYWYLPRTDTEGDNTVEVYVDDILVATSDSTSSETPDWVQETVTLTDLAAGDHTITFYGAGIENRLGGFIDDTSLTCIQDDNGNTDDGPTRVTVYTYVINDDGGEMDPSEATMDLLNNDVLLTSFAGSDIGVTTLVDPGTFDVNGTLHDDYDRFVGPGCEGSIGLNEHVVCSVTYDDIAEFGNTGDGGDGDDDDDDGDNGGGDSSPGSGSNPPSDPSDPAPEPEVLGETDEVVDTTPDIGGGIPQVLGETDELPRTGTPTAAIGFIALITMAAAGFRRRR